MASIRHYLLFATLTLFGAGQAWANMGPVPQRPQPAVGAQLAVVVSPDDAKSQLLVPKSLVLGRSESGIEPAAKPYQEGSLRSRTVVAGLALSFLVVGGGAVTVLVRQRRGRAAVIAAGAVVVLLGVCASVSLADLPPRPNTGKTFDLKGPYSGQVPKSQVPERLESGIEPAAKPHQEESLRSRTVVAGLALSFLVVGGGAVTVLVRQRRGRAAVIAAGAVVVLLGVCVSVSLADIPPRPNTGNTFELEGPYSGQVPPKLTAYQAFGGEIAVELVDSGNQVTLVIGRDLLDDFVAMEKPPTRRTGRGGLGAAPPQ